MAPYTLTDSGVCFCDGYTDGDGNCVVCSNSNEFFNGTECETCGSYCDTCSTPSGDCTACQSNFSIIDGKCACPLGWYDQNSAGTCVEATVVCSTGYYNDGQDNCVQCGTECAECEDFTAECTVCNGDLDVNPFDSTECGDCFYSVGPVDAPTGCIKTPYSDTRVIEPYPAGTTTLDWRDWDVVNGMEN